MADEKEIFPGFQEMLDTAVNKAMINAFADLDYVKMKQCQERVEELSNRLGNAEAKAVAYEELWQRRKSDVRDLEDQIVELKARVLLLESALKNQQAGEVTAGDDE